MTTKSVSKDLKPNSTNNRQEKSKGLAALGDIVHRFLNVSSKSGSDNLKIKASIHVWFRIIFPEPAPSAIP